MTETKNNNWLPKLISRWREDPDSTYQTWFLWEERLKNFRSIRKGLLQVIQEIETGAFGSSYRGSSLEAVLRSVAEQRQIFRQADHAFVWKPKLRIPDIYENHQNQMAFGQFLKTCIECCKDEGIVRAIQNLERQAIKGLGPAAANLLYFLHPTLVPPSNTAIVKGYNSLTGAKVKLGRWSEYLAMRGGIVRMNGQHQNFFSNDYGAISGFLFDIGSGRYALPPQAGDEKAGKAWEADLLQVREQSAASRKLIDEARAGDKSHTEIQACLRDIGLALGFQVWIASNDRSRAYGKGALGDGCLSELPKAMADIPSIDVIRMIDVLWLKSSSIVAAFEVEHTTSIYSGILRLGDLALSDAGQMVKGLYLVAPDNRESEVRSQISRPAFQNIATLSVRFLPYSGLVQHGETIARFGEGLKAIEAIAKNIV